MVRILAVIFGLAFIFTGVAGYGAMPELIHDGLLFGYIQIDPIHNLIHLGIGIAAILAASNTSLSRIFFVLIGFLFIAAAGVGFYQNGDLYFVQMNMPENYIHLGLGVLALIIGIASRE